MPEEYGQRQPSRWEIKPVRVPLPGHPAYELGRVNPGGTVVLDVDVVDLENLRRVIDDFLREQEVPPLRKTAGGRSSVPDDFPVRPLISHADWLTATDLVTCGTCGRSWDDAVATEYTPTPAGRCPFEAFH